MPYILTIGCSRGSPKDLMDKLSQSYLVQAKGHKGLVNFTGSYFGHFGNLCFSLPAKPKTEREDSVLEAHGLVVDTELNLGLKTTVEKHVRSAHKPYLTTYYIVPKQFCFCTFNKFNY